MTALSPVSFLVSAIIGMITAIVSYRVLRKELKLDSPLLAMCIGALTGVGLATQMGGNMSAILIPYEALGIAVVLLFLMMPFFRDKKGKDKKSLPPRLPHRTNTTTEDPWEKEIRLGGKLAPRFRVNKRNKYGAMLMPCYS